MCNLMDLDLIKRVGVKAAVNGGKILMKHFGHLEAIDKKGEIDLVTIADTESENAIIKTIKSGFPEHSILAEESGLEKGDDGMWIIDPLDGTTNYANGLGIFGVSIAFSRNDKILAGIVLNPVSGELFTAVKGKGADLNGSPITVSPSALVSDSLLVTGFPYDLKTIFKPLMTRFSTCLKNARGVRRLGSASIDLCYVACGRFDGFWEQNLKPWDTAAGVLIAQEASARITDFSSQPFLLDKKEILCTNGTIHDEMISLLNVEEQIQ